MRYIIELGLFESDGYRITCFKMLSRLDSSMTSNVKMRQIISNAKKNHDTVMTQSCKKRLEQNRTEEKRREEEREDGKKEEKDKPSHTPKEKHKQTGRPISQARYDSLVKDYGKTLVDDYIQRVADYSDSTGKKYKDYSAAAANWIKKDGVQRIGQGLDVTLAKPLEMED